MSEFIAWYFFISIAAFVITAVNFWIAHILFDAIKLIRGNV